MPIKNTKKSSTIFNFGDGLIGQAALEKKQILVTDIPKDYITVTSALGETLPRNILCIPFLYEDQVKCVIELGSLESFSKQQINFLNQVGESIAIAINTAQVNEQTKKLLEESQSQSEELQSQQEELRTTNEELEQKSVELEKSAALLEAQRTELEEALNAEQQQLHSLFDGINDVIYAADPETYELLFVNEVFRKNWGDDVIGKKCYYVLQDRNEPCPFCTNDKIFGKNAGKTYVWEYQNEVNKNWYRCADKAIQWSDGRMVRFQLASDITEFKNKEEASRQSIDRLKMLTENSGDWIWEVNQEGVYTYVSPGVEKVLGHKPDDVVGKRPFDFIIPDDVKHIGKEFEAIVQDKRPIENLVDRNFHKDGHVVVLETNGIPFFNETGELAGYRGINRDITKHYKVENEI